jgi:hypothetical protein
MSYCRWSSDDFQCDVYVYEHMAGGFVVHIADNRVVYSEPLPPPLKGKFDPNAWIERHRVVSEIMNRSERRTIGLEHDGETMSTDTAGEMAELLGSLRGKGYNVPQYAIDRLLEEVEEEK